MFVSLIYIYEQLYLTPRIHILYSITLHHISSDCIPLYPKFWLAFYIMLMPNSIFKPKYGVSFHMWDPKVTVGVHTIS